VTSEEKQKPLAASQKDKKAWRQVGKTEWEIPD